MERKNFKFYIVSVLFLVAFLLGTNDSSAQATPVDKVVVSTTQYSALSPTTFIFGGSYYGNTLQKPFTTYFQFKKGNSDFTVDAEETIPTVRQTNINNLILSVGGESGVFYANPNLKLFSNYYFRAVGCFNNNSSINPCYKDNSSQKFYGNTMNFNTGSLSGSIPFIFQFNGQVGGAGGAAVAYTPISCKVAGDVFDPLTYTCITPISCTYPQVFDVLKRKCITPITCGTGEVFSVLDSKCVVQKSCVYPEVLDVLTNDCFKPLSCSYPAVLDVLKNSCVTPTSFKATNITTNSVTLTATELNPNISYMFQISSGPASSIINKQAIVSNSGVAQAFVPGLSSDQFYSAAIMTYDPTKPSIPPTRGVGLPAVQFTTLAEDNKVVPTVVSTTPSATPSPTSSPGLVPCGTASTKPCTFVDFITLLNNVIKFIFTSLVVPIAAIMFAYAGLLLVTAGGEAAHARTKAKEIFTNAVIGLVIAAAAWLIIKTLLSILAYKYGVTLGT